MEWIRARLTRVGEALRPGGMRAAGILLLLAGLVAAPFPYGGILPRGSATIEVLAFLAAAAAFGASRPESSPLGGAWLPVAALLGIAALGLLQLVPLPAGLLAMLSPASAGIHARAREVVAAAGGVPGPPRISIAPSETFGTLLLVLAYVAIFLAAGRLLTTRSSRRLTLTVLAVTALAQVVLAAAGDASEDRVHGAFVNPNHFAGYLEIVLAVAFGVLWAEVLAGHDRASDAKDRAERIERRVVPLALRVLLWGAVAAGIALTRSRGGLLAAGVTTAVLVALALLSTRRGGARSRSRRGLALAVLAGALFAAAAAGEGSVLRFLASDPRDIPTDFRLDLWRTSVRAFREFPLLGSGLGTFREAFQRVQPRELPGLVEQAHGDGLQLLVTGGAVGAALGLLAFVSLFFVLARAFWRQQHREESALVLAGLGALLSLTLHGLVDFGLSIPAIPATLACVLGAAWAAARDRRDETQVPTLAAVDAVESGSA